MKNILIIILALLMSVAVIPIASADCPADLQACEQLLNDCPEQDCSMCPTTEKHCTFKEVIVDRKVQAAIITIVVGIVGGVAGFFLSAGG